jgi:hypothetical protein
MSLDRNPASNGTEKINAGKGVYERLAPALREELVSLVKGGYRPHWRSAAGIAVLRNMLAAAKRAAETPSDREFVLDLERRLEPRLRDLTSSGSLKWDGWLRIRPDVKEVLRLDDIIRDRHSRALWRQAGRVAASRMRAARRG